MGKVQLRRTWCTTLFKPMLVGIGALQMGFLVGHVDEPVRIRATLERALQNLDLESQLLDGGARTGKIERDPPVHFESNLGQEPDNVRYLTRARDYDFLLTDDEVIWTWSSARTPQRQSNQSAVRMQFVNAEHDTEPVALDPLTGRSHYLLGDSPENWVTHVPHYRSVRYRDVYPGIDVVYHSNRQRLEFDVVVAPGSDPRIVEMDLDGARDLRLVASGDLEVETATGTLTLRAPSVYQDIAGDRVVVPGRFERRAEHRIGFDISDYDAEHPLVIDPIVSFSTYLGGSGSEEADDKSGIIADASGNVYIASRTTSTDYPLAQSLQSTPGGLFDAMITKMDPSTGTLLYSTYIGGSGNEGVRSIAVDGAGGVYLVGETSSADFPTQHPVQPFLAGEDDAFVLKLDPSGSSLVYSTFLGGSGIDLALGVAIDPFTATYVVGTTSSSDFPIVNAVQPAFGGFADAFLVQLNPTGSEIVSSTYWGGSAREIAIEVATDPAGDAYVTGLTESSDFPTSNALQSTYGGGGAFFGDAFVAKFTDNGTGVAYSTYLGGTSDDLGQAIAVDTLGNAYIAGATGSLDFPLVNAFQSTLGDFVDVFVAKLDAAGANLLYSTYLGGDGADLTHGIAIDDSGNAYVTGQTTSTDFPVVDAVEATYGGGTDAFVLTLNAVGSGLKFSSYFGGAAEDKGLDIALGPNGDVFFGGHTASPDLTTANPLQASLNGPFDAYVAQLTEPRPEITLELEDAGGQPRLTIRLSNPGTDPREVEIKIWFESVLFPDPISFVGTPSPVGTLPAQLPPFALATLDLPVFLSFPGTIVGASLTEPVTGRLLSHTSCRTVPCP